MNFDTMPERGDFVKNIQNLHPPNDERFYLNDNFDRSTLLSKVRRVKGREFDSYSNRRPELIAQGGNPEHTDVVQKGARPEEFYEAEQKEKKLMKRLDANCLEFEKYEPRS